LKTSVIRLQVPFINSALPMAHPSFFVLVVIKTASKSHCCPVEIHAAICLYQLAKICPIKIHGTKAGINDFTSVS
jgi:hypothetical protein